MGTFSHRFRSGWGHWGIPVCTKRENGDLYRPFLFSAFFVFKGPFAFVNVQTSSSFFIKTPCSFKWCRFSLYLSGLSCRLVRSGPGGGEIWNPGFACFFRFPAYFCLKRRSSLRFGEEMGTGTSGECYRLNRKKISELFMVLCLSCGMSGDVPNAFYYMALRKNFSCYEGASSRLSLSTGCPVPPLGFRRAGDIPYLQEKMPRCFRVASQGPGRMACLAGSLFGLAEAISAGGWRGMGW